MGVDESVGMVVGTFVLVGMLLMVMERMERTIDRPARQPVPADRQPWWRRRGREW